MLWFWSALIAAVLWGLSYSLGEYTLKNGMTASSQMALFSLFMMPVYNLIAWRNGTLGTGFEALRSNPKVLVSFLVIAACYSVANFLSFYAIQQKNATVASLVEITYPLFVALFAFLLFREMQLTPGVMLGGGLILAGICVMYATG